MGLGECCKLCSRVRGRAPATHAFLHTFSSKDGLMQHLKVGVPRVPPFSKVGVREPLIPLKLRPWTRRRRRSCRRISGSVEFAIIAVNPPRNIPSRRWILTLEQPLYISSKYSIPDPGQSLCTMMDVDK